MKVASAPLLLMDCHPCEGNRVRPPAFSSPPHMPPRARRHFFVLGGGPNGDYTAFFSLCQEPDTLSRVGMASGRCRFLPHPLTGTDWSEGGGGPRLSQQTGASAFMPSLWSSPDQPWSPPRGSGAGVRYENTQWPWCARPLNRQAP